MNKVVSHVRSSHRSCSVIKGVLRNFAKFTGKHLCRNTFLRTHFLQNTSVLLHVAISNLLDNKMRKKCIKGGFRKLSDIKMFLWFCQHLLVACVGIPSSVRVGNSWIEKLSYEQVGKLEQNYITSIMIMVLFCVNLLSANFRKWSNTLRQFVGNLKTNYLSVFGHFVGLELKGLRFNFFYPF